MPKYKSVTLIEYPQKAIIKRKMFYFTMTVCSDIELLLFLNSNKTYHVYLHHYSDIISGLENTIFQPIMANLNDIFSEI